MDLDEKDREFTKWWRRDGIMFDPDTEDVPWFDKREGLAEYAWDAAMRQSEEMRGQLRRIIEADSNRDSRLRGQTAWHPFVNPERPDWLAWRECDEGREILAYNNALCDPIVIYSQRTPEQPAPKQDGVHNQHWRNPETGQAECECCCGWALDMERERKEHAGALAESRRGYYSAEQLLAEPTLGEWANLPRSFQSQEECDKLSSFDWCKLLIANRLARLSSAQEQEGKCSH